ncbi:MAG: FkbM family methyltransferase [Bacteroidota bacterium]|nr:FkbM family methyltransferase [Bacteroidota bacterium]
MDKQFFINVAAKIKYRSFRKLWISYFFKKHGLKLQYFESFRQDRFFMYKVENIYLPSELFEWAISFDILLKKAREESLYFYEPQKGDTIIDIGAGLGEEALVYGNLTGDKGKVFSIEANPAVFEMLQKTVDLNRHNQTKVFNLAIFNKNGKVDIEDDRSSYQTKHIKEISPVEKGIPAVTMDTFITSNLIDRIDFLKSNIEGAERFIIESIKPEQIQKVRNIAIACHDFRYEKEGNDFFRTKQLVTDFLAQHGFEIKSRNTGFAYLDDWIYGTNKNFHSTTSNNQI